MLALKKLVVLVVGTRLEDEGTLSTSWRELQKGGSAYGRLALSNADRASQNIQG